MSDQSETPPALLYVLLSRQEIEALVDLYKTTSPMGAVGQRAAACMIDYDNLELAGRDTTKCTGFGLLEWEAERICNDLRVGSGTLHQQAVAKKCWRVFHEFRRPTAAFPYPNAVGDYIDRRWHKDLLKDWVYAE